MANVQENPQITAELAKELEANLSKVPNEAQHMFVKCHASLYWGGYWGFVSSTAEDYAAIKAALPTIIRDYAGKVNASMVKGGILIVADTKWLLQILTTLAPKFAAKECTKLQENLKTTAATETENFRKFWKKTQEGKTDMFAAKDADGNQRLTGTLGVYCTNSVNNITVNGIDYPAYKLGADAVCNMIAASPNADRIYVSVADVEAKKNVWMPIREVIMKNLYAKALSFPVDVNGRPVSSPNALLIRFAIK